MSMSVLFRTPHPTRLELHMAPGTRGPMKNAQQGEMDPASDISIYAGGKKMTVSNWVWDALGNRYLIFLSEPITGELLQVIHHIPDPPFMVMSNPLLANLTQGNNPTLAQEH